MIIFFIYIFLRLGKCVPKVWGGCNKTPNNFGTKEACEAKCPPKKDQIDLKNYKLPIFGYAAYTDME